MSIYYELSFAPFMKLIVGLCNPGKKYEKTRHNIGCMVVEQFLKDFEPVGKTLWENSEKFKSDIAELEWQKSKHDISRPLLEQVMLIKPKTYMNNSGMAVRVISSRFVVHSNDIWIVHDDIDLPLGSMKIRFGGGAGGHHGVESIIKTLNTDKFWRFRMGIGNPNQNSKLKVESSKLKNVEDYVLGNFTGAEHSQVKKMLKHGSSALQMALDDSLEAAMNRYNTK